jgi:hypothetical protein
MDKPHFLQTMAGQIFSKKDDIQFTLERKYPDFFQEVEMIGLKYRIYYTPWSQSFCLMVYSDGSHAEPALTLKIIVSENDIFEYEIDKTEALISLEEFRQRVNSYKRHPKPGK